MCLHVSVWLYSLDLQMRAWLRWYFLHFSMLFWSGAKPNTFPLNYLGLSQPELPVNELAMQQKYEQERRPAFDAHVVSGSVYCSSDQQHQCVIPSLCVKKQLTGSSVHKQTSAEPAQLLPQGITLKFLSRVNSKPHIFSQTPKQTSPLAYKLWLTLRSNLFPHSLHS